MDIVWFCLLTGAAVLGFVSLVLQFQAGRLGRGEKLALAWTLACLAAAAVFAARLTAANYAALAAAQ